jgi:hypothetical protein
VLQLTGDGFLQFSTYQKRKLNGVDPHPISEVMSL